MGRQRHLSLPLELIERIGDHLFELRLPNPDYTGDTSIIHSKPSWIEVQGFMSASIHFHGIGFVRWLRVVTVINADDWAVILPRSSFVREIQCLDGVFDGTIPQHPLAQFPNLYAARIDAHSDISHSEDGGFAYRDVVTILPPSLKRLEVVNAHGPDIKVIATVKKHCPNIEELRLGRCTMFNRIPACEFWCAFPHDHNSYISTAGTESYARSLGGELLPLNNLHSLKMGLYLSPSNIVLAHRLYHRRGRAAPEHIDWRAITLPFESNSLVGPENIEPATTDQLISVLHQRDSQSGTPFDCQLCADVTAETTRIAEATANGILRGYVPSLSRIEWMGWLTPGHMGVHSFDFHEDWRMLHNPSGGTSTVVENGPRFTLGR